MGVDITVETVDWVDELATVTVLWVDSQAMDLHLEGALVGLLQGEFYNSQDGWNGAIVLHEQPV